MGIVKKIGYWMNSFTRNIRYFGSSIKIKGKAQIHPSVRIKNCNIKVDKTSELILEEGVTLSGIKLTVTKGARVHMMPYSELRQNTNPLKGNYIIDSGSLIVGHHTSSRAYRIWVRFNGVVELGCYTNINDGTEIRADERVTIGDYTAISFNIRIWDTNTHNLYTEEENKEKRIRDFPDMGHEYSRPKTAPVEIGDHGWVGERASILKGTKIGRNVVVGYNTLLSNVTIEDNTVVVQKPQLIMFEKKK